MAEEPVEETQTYPVLQKDEAASYMFKKTFQIDLSRLFEQDKPKVEKIGLQIKKDYKNYLKSNKDLSIFEQSFFALVWKIYAPALTPDQIEQLERFIMTDLKSFYLFFCYNLHNLIQQQEIKTSVIPRKKRQLPLTHHLTRLHNFVTFETEPIKNYKFLINFLLANTN